jgi:hypothetical protein
VDAIVNGMTVLRPCVAVAIVLLALAVAGCMTVDRNAPSGWQTGGGWQNFRAEAGAMVAA